MQINILEYLDKTVEKYPQKTAIIDNDKTISFQELNEKAKKLATFIAKSNIINQPIAIYLPKCINSIVSDIAITYSGNAYMNLDVKNPIERITNICNLIQPKFVITTSKYKSKIENIADINIINLDEFDFNSKINEEVLNSISSKMIDTDPYCIINTSGSTGTPKGVLISHRSIIDYIEWATKEYNITNSEIIGNQAPFYFDNSVLDIYLTLKNACKLIITPENLFIFPIKLMEYFKEKNVNMLFFVPSILVNIANMDILKSCKPAFNKILFAGEVMPTKQLNYWIKHYPNALFSNLYGPTEITVDCTYYTIDRKFADDEPLPIGKKCRNSDVLILDENNKLITEPNCAGELCVRGSSLALGYYNDLEKTENAFTQNPLNNHYPEKIYRTGDMVYYNNKMEIIFQGRKDFQIKHMGYRIELGEIETALGTIKDLENVCVVYDSKNSKIVLFYEAKNEISNKDLILAIGNTLPKYMFPNELRKIDKLPINANGKIDRLKLKNSL